MLSLIGLTLKCQLKRYLCCHHVLLLLMLSKNFGGKFKYLNRKNSEFLAGNLNSRCKMQMQMLMKMQIGSALNPSIHLQNKILGRICTNPKVTTGNWDRKGSYYRTTRDWDRCNRGRSHYRSSRYWYNNNRKQQKRKETGDKDNKTGHSFRRTRH